MIASCQGHEAMISNVHVTHTLQVKLAELGAVYRNGAQHNIAKHITVNLTKQNKSITILLSIASLLLYISKVSDIPDPKLDMVHKEVQSTATKFTLCL